MRQLQVKNGKRHGISAAIGYGGLTVTYCGLYGSKEEDALFAGARSSSINCKKCLASIARLDRLGAI